MSQPPPVADAPNSPRPSQTARTSLLLGVASLLLPLVAGLPALVLGYRALYAINASDGRLTGRRVAVSGLVLGGISTIAAIVGFILLIFVNLIQKSRLKECEFNLGRIGMALNVYYDVLPDKVFPLAAIPNDALPFGDRLSWQVAILPYLDQTQPIGKRWKGLYEQIDKARAWSHPANAPAADTVVAVFLCPNDPNYYPPVRPAPTDYPGISGVGPDAVLLSKGDARAGFFNATRPLHRADATRGLSETLMVLETAAQNGPWIAAGFPTVRDIPLDNDRLVGIDAPFGGNHAGGMNALFMDGHVSFLRDNIDPNVLRNLARLTSE